MIPDHLEALLRPLEEFEGIRREVVRLGARLCDLAYANPYDGAEERTRAAIRDALDSSRLLDLQYTPFGGATLARRAVADALREERAHPYTFRDVVLTPGAMAALHVALRAAGQAGDEVVIPVPCWLDHPLYTQYLGLKPVFVELRPPAFALDLDAIAGAITERTCAILLTHPSNPTGRLHTGPELRALGEVLGEAERRHDRRLTLIADEAHRDFVAPGAYRPATEAWPDTVSLYSFGKTHFIQGQRIGYAAVSPRHRDRGAAADELVRWTRVMGFATPTALMQRAIPKLLTGERDHPRIAQWRERVARELRAAGYGVVPADATLFTYVETPPGTDDFAFTRALARRGVLVLPAPLFHHRGFFRIALTGSDEMLERALIVFREMAAPATDTP